ncbi:acetolactate synthase 2 small subunit [Pantoea sp. BRM17]|nr:acetolactate synthase 2 small subunit [Pantoea sp. BRM17]
MNQHQLSIEARFRPEVLERILRVVRHRGFQVCAMNMGSASNADNIAPVAAAVFRWPL